MPAGRTARRRLPLPPGAGCGQEGGLFGWQVGGERIAELGSRDGQLHRHAPFGGVLLGDQGAVEHPVLRVRLDLPNVSPSSGADGHEDQADDALGLGRGVRDDRAAVGMADRQNGSLGLRQNAGGIGGVVGDSPCTSTTVGVCSDIGFVLSYRSRRGSEAVAADRSSPY